MEPGPLSAVYGARGALDRADAVSTGYRPTAPAARAGVTVPAVSTREPKPGVTVRHPRGGPADVRSVALILHGGRSASTASARPWRLAALRMRPFARVIGELGHGVAVWAVQYRYRGWNDAAADPVEDARWALDEVSRRHGRIPVVLVGHSMGGRVALRVAGHDGVTGVAALAPWLPEGEPVDQLVGRTVLIAHGDRDRMTDSAGSLEYARRARAVTAVARFEVRGDGHAMLRRAGDWHRLVARFAAGMLGIEPVPPEIANALRAPNGLQVALPHRG